MLALSVVSNAGEFDAHALMNDARQYVTAPMHWDGDDWMTAGVSLAAVGAAYEYDEDVRAHFIDGEHAAPTGRDPDGTRQMLPVALLFAGTLAVAALSHSQAVYGESGSMAEAAALGGFTTLGLKHAFGRQRANDTDHANDWFSGGDSFPSTHATLAFAAGTVFAESGNDRYRWARRTLGYGMAAGTAYLRVRDNVHWLSDTVAGAVVGVAAARFVMARHDRPLLASHVRLEPVEGGLMLSYSAPLQ